MAKNYYDVLGVSKNASQQEIKNAYSKKINDPQIDANQRQQIIQAYQILSDTQKRNDYDMINDNMRIRSKKVKKTQYNTETTYFSETQKDIDPKKLKRKLIFWAIIIVVIAFLIAAIIIFGFIKLFPIIVVLLLVYIVIKMLR